MRSPIRLLPAFALALLLPSRTFADGGLLAPGDLAWLRRDGFGLDTVAIDSCRGMGRRQMLELQLQDRMPGSLPQAVADQLASNPALTTRASEALAQWHQAQERIRSMPEGEARSAARNELQRQGNQWVQQARAAELLQAIYGPNQLKEQMVWFWLNHFSVYAPKGRIRWEVGDYAEHVIRPRALGKFRELVLATLKSPAMLEYLDNVQNAKGHVNENYARELVELHTLGVDGGYTQQDVQQLALILTGVGIAPLDGLPRPIAPALAPRLVREGLFEFNPNRHDFSDKVLLGHSIRGRGFPEVEEAVDWIVQQPACGRFLSRKLAEYFVGDQPPAALVERMALAFRKSEGDIAEVLRTLFDSSELVAGAGGKFKDPFQLIISAMRLAYDGRPIYNPRPLIHLARDARRAAPRPHYPRRLAARRGELVELWPARGPLCGRPSHRERQSAALPPGRLDAADARVSLAHLPSLLRSLRAIPVRGHSQRPGPGAVARRMEWPAALFARSRLPLASSARFPSMLLARSRGIGVHRPRGARASAGGRWHARTRESRTAGPWQLPCPGTTDSLAVAFFLISTILEA